MKKFLLLISLLSTGAAFSQTKSYPGNGNDLFGGAIGKGSMSITETTDSVSFSLNRGTGLFDSLLVFYIDDPKTTTGIATTAGLTPVQTTQDKYYFAASAKHSSGAEARLDFAAGFRPDLAVVFDKDGGKLYALVSTATPFGQINGIQERGTFSITPSGTNSAPVYTQKIAKGDFGANDTLNFNFYGTYIGQTASRSNEAFGDPMTGYQRVAGYNPYTVRSWFNYSTSQAALPVSVSGLKANEEQGKVRIAWTAAQEINIDQYDVQRSTNGVNFTTISSVNAKNSSTITAYSVVDPTPAAGTNYYRLVIKEKGKTEVTNVVAVETSGAKSAVSVYFGGNKINLSLAGLAAGAYTLSVVNNNGQLLQNTTIQHDGADITRSVEVKAALNKGVYRAVLQSATQKFTQSFFIQ